MGLLTSLLMEHSRRQGQKEQSKIQALTGIIGNENLPDNLREWAKGALLEDKQFKQYKPVMGTIFEAHGQAREAAKAAQQGAPQLPQVPGPMGGGPMDVKRREAQVGPQAQTPRAPSTQDLAALPQTRMNPILPASVAPPGQEITYSGGQPLPSRPGQAQQPPPETPQGPPQLAQLPQTITRMTPSQAFRPIPPVPGTPEAGGGQPSQARAGRPSNTFADFRRQRSDESFADYKRRQELQHAQRMEEEAAQAKARALAAAGKPMGAPLRQPGNDGLIHLFQRVPRADGTGVDLQDLGPAEGKGAPRAVPVLRPGSKEWEFGYMSPNWQGYRDVYGNVIEGAQPTQVPREILSGANLTNYNAVKQAHPDWTHEQIMEAMGAMGFQAENVRTQRTQQIGTREARDSGVPMGPGMTIPGTGAAPTPSAPPATPVGSPEIQRIAADAARKYGVNPGLVQRVMQAESGGRTDALSPKGAIGPMQLMPDTAKELGVDPNDPQQNIDGGVRYLAQMLQRYGGDEAKALAAYNAGPGAVDSGKPLPKETQDYVAKISGGGAVSPWIAPPIPGATGATAPAPTPGFSPEDQTDIDVYVADAMGTRRATGGQRTRALHGQELLAKATGLDPVTFNALMTQNKAQAKQLAETVQRKGAIDRLNNTLEAHGKNLVDSAKAIMQSGSPIINQPWRKAVRAIEGSPELTQYRVFANAYQKEYGTLTAGAAQSRAMLPVSVSDKMEKLFADDATFAEVIASVEAVNTEAKTETQAMVKTERDIIEDMRSGVIGKAAGADKTKLPPLPGEAKEPPTISTRAQYDALPSGTEYVKDGKRYKKR